MTNKVQGFTYVEKYKIAVISTEIIQELQYPTFVRLPYENQHSVYMHN